MTRDSIPTIKSASQPGIVGQIATQMLTINAGQIVLKDEGKNLCWAVNLRPFRIGQFVVTQEQYCSLAQIPSVKPDDLEKPMVEVSWLDAIHFCNLLSNQAGLPECYSCDAAGEVVCHWESTGYRLPSEAEWEFACRAGSSEVRYGELDDIAWHG